MIELVILGVAVVEDRPDPDDAPSPEACSELGLRLDVDFPPYCATDSVYGSVDDVPVTAVVGTEGRPTGVDATVPAARFACAWARAVSFWF